MPINNRQWFARPLRPAKPEIPFDETATYEKFQRGEAFDCFWIHTPEYTAVEWPTNAVAIREAEAREHCGFDIQRDGRYYDEHGGEWEDFIPWCRE